MLKTNIKSRKLIDLNLRNLFKKSNLGCQTLLDLQPNMSIFQITNDVPVILDDGLTVDKPKKTTSVSNRSTLVTLTEAIDLEAALTLNEKKFYSDDKKVKPGELKHFLNVVIFQKKLNKFHLEYIIRV